MENWRDVVGYESWYQVSDLGHVRRVKPGQGARIGSVLKLSNSHGYSAVSLWKNGEGKSESVHTLVLEAFIGVYPKGYQCNHKNGDRADNRVENLEWVTPSQNAMHASHVLGTVRRGIAHPNAIHTVEEVLEIRELHATGQYTQRRLATKFGCSQQNVHEIVNRVIWKHI